MKATTRPEALQTLKLAGLINELEHQAEQMAVNIQMHAEPVDVAECEGDWLYCQRKYSARERTAMKHLAYIKELARHASNAVVPSIDRAIHDLPHWRVVR